MSIQEISFHTTQYDLNDTIGGDWVWSNDSFHTTQYDLNKNTETSKKPSATCFHTTQYDLNSLKCICELSKFRFPYYIVRFKHFFFFFFYFSHFLFPYYIVRFKLYFSREFFFRKNSFHTTQYDLNSENHHVRTVLVIVSILHSTI